MAASTTLTVRGFKVRTQSHFRYQLVRVRPEASTETYEYTVRGSEGATTRERTITHEAGAKIVGRTDSLSSARERASKLRVAGTALVIVDRETGEEVS